ncbi:uncharacterized protein TRIADDRAFT_57907 [Trichoplax adhaerens]|uniref:Synaptonemal complex protein 2 Spt16M-like domain-containing protein n=1 Tax=Trichoplax adhaerens TaxID=10228 RepID=B3S231_TRIAD|nr:predicted protein [Trichoplax adhaerens]EDV23043.1 predicted protein [Trichoplax adhaerens]|eukprot:XP_002113953.1 predicted protein [Trichoplax adhaerens]
MAVNLASNGKCVSFKQLLLQLSQSVDGHKHFLALAKLANRNGLSDNLWEDLNQENRFHWMYTSWKKSLCFIYMTIVHGILLLSISYISKVIRTVPQLPNSQTGNSEEILRETLTIVAYSTMNHSEHRKSVIVLIPDIIKALFAVNLSFNCKDQTCRSFLNTFNSQGDVCKRVISIPCEKIMIGKKEFKPIGMEEDNSWVDFNSGSRSIKLYLDACQFEETESEWDVIIIKDQIVKTHVIKEDMANIKVLVLHLRVPISSLLPRFPKSTNKILEIIFQEKYI